MKKNFFFILVDCLRTDYAYGKRRGPIIPNLMNFCNKGVIFEQAIATTSNTSPNVADILTGVYPVRHGIISLHNNRLGEDIVTVGEILKSFGYNTYAQVSGPLIPELGLSRGFDVYKHRSKEEYLGSGWEDYLYHFIDTLQPPWFFFLHIWSLHAPRRVSELFRSSKYGTNRYERSISTFDYFFGKILEKIRKWNPEIILTGDHGESIKTDGMRDYVKRLVGKIHEPTTNKFSKKIKKYLIRKIRSVQVDLNMRKDGWLARPGHGFHIYDYLIRVPLIFLPSEDLNMAVKRVKRQVRHVDIMPTILEYLLPHWSSRYPLDGLSLFSCITGKASVDTIPPAFIAAVGECLLGEENHLFGMRTSQYKYIYSLYDKNYHELYDLSLDPHETRNIYQKNPDVAISLQRQVEKLLSQKRTSKMSEEEQKRLEHVLKDLGYL